MKLKVVIVVYNRYENLKHWLKCWAKIPDKQGAELVVVHNADEYNDLDKIPESSDYRLVNRQNKGFDIGAFQEAINCPSLTIGEWDRLLWITDDTIPMSLDFIKQFNMAMRPNVGVACMQISTSVRTHIRTTGFMIDKATAEKLVWHVYPIVTKEDCYQFEHRHPKLTFYAQIKKMGLKVVQVAHDSKSPLWDTGYNKKLDRKAEHEAIFGPLPDSFNITTVRAKKQRVPNADPGIGEIFHRIIAESDNVAFVQEVDLGNRPDAVIPASEPEPVKPYEPLYQITTGQPTTPAWAVITFIVPIYKSYPAIISSLLMQTNPNWCLWLIHDGPGEIEKVSDDPRIQYIFTDKRQESWGHIYRRDFLQLVGTEFVTISNADNQVVPVFVEYMLRGFKPGINATFSSAMVHSYTAWGVIDCSLRRGYIDCAGVVMRTKEAQAVGWNDITSHSADWQFFRDLINKYGHRSFAKVKGCLLIHN